MRWLTQELRSLLLPGKAPSKELREVEASVKASIKKSSMLVEASGATSSGDIEQKPEPL